MGGPLGMNAYMGTIDVALSDLNVSYFEKYNNKAVINYVLTCLTYSLDKDKKDDSARSSFFICIQLCLNSPVLTKDRNACRPIRQL